jgi:hypothetical protein
VLEAGGVLVGDKVEIEVEVELVRGVGEKAALREERRNDETTRRRNGREERRGWSWVGFVG